jgi:hypothetical protein
MFGLRLVFLSRINSASLLFLIVVFNLKSLIDLIKIIKSNSTRLLISVFDLNKLNNP